MKIIVVGGGILGASAAYHLARAHAEVVLVDQAHEGRATAAGAGIICPWAAIARDADLYDLLCAAAAYYPTLLDHLAADGEQEVSYRRVGALVVDVENAALDHIEKAVATRAAKWPEAGTISRLSSADAVRRFPPLRHDFGAVHIAGGARVDGRLIAAALLRAAQRHGARVVEGEAALTLVKDRVSGVRLGTELISGDAVIVAAGAWAPGLMPAGRRELGVLPQRGQIVHLHLPGVETRDWPVILPRTDHYLLAFDDSRIVVGATRETGAGFDYRVTAGGLAEVIAQALQVAPGLAPATVLETRVGFRPLSADGKPLLGTWSEGLIVGNGLGPSGLTLGPFCGYLLAQLALGQKTAVDLVPFRPDRFAVPLSGN
jgi:D-amino-acid dehydrogenase